MIVDTSVVIAILRKESDGGALASAIRAADHCRISAASFLEAAIVIDSSGDPLLSRDLDHLAAEVPFRIEPVTAAQVQLARRAYRDFGKRSGHPAQLNFGNCFAYALAKALDEPLLFKGNDFVHTDVARALP